MFLTEEEVDVAKRIDKGQTILVVGTGTEELKEAQKKADSMKSYPYEVFHRDQKTGRKKHWK